EDISATTNSYLEVQITATDSKGLTSTATRNLNPKLVGVTFGTTPAGLHVEMAGSDIATPRTVSSWDRWAFSVKAADQSDGGGRPYDFVSWSDGGAATHTITTPSSPATYTAAFEPAYDRPRQSAGPDFSLVPAFRQPVDATLLSRLRLSDRYNGAGTAHSGTVTDFDFAVPVDCAANPDPVAGSACGASTSADAVTPGAVREGKHAVMQVFHQRLVDSGADG